LIWSVDRCCGRLCWRWRENGTRSW